MIIQNRHLGWTGCGPAKDDPPLVVDPDGVKAGEFALQRLQMVARRNGEIGQFAGVIHLEKLSQGHTGNRGKAAVGLVDKQVFRVFVGKGLDHFALGIYCGVAAIQPEIFISATISCGETIRTPSMVFP